MDASGSRGGSAAPVSVLQAAINKAFESAAKGNGTGGTHAKPRFIPARRFEGARSGYCFTTGDEGTGYYYDPLNDGGENEEAQAPVVPAPVVLAPEELLRQVRSSPLVKTQTSSFLFFERRVGGCSQSRLLRGAAMRYCLPCRHAPCLHPNIRCDHTCPLETFATNCQTLNFPVQASLSETHNQAEEAAGLDDTDMATLDAKSLRRMCSALDRKVKENMGLRLKYASSHDKFMQSEIDLHDMVRRPLSPPTPCGLAPL